VAEAGDIRVGVNARSEPIPPGYEWKKIGEIRTTVRGGVIVTPKWQVVRIADGATTKVPPQFVAGVVSTGLILYLLWGV